MQKQNNSLHFEVHLVEHCNLNCKGCAHFSPLANEEFLDLKRFEQDLKRLCEISNNNISYIKLLGGEPLLHPQVEEFFYITRRYLPKTDIILITNGILIPKMNKNFWESCKSNNVKIEITKYPINCNYKIIEKILIHEDIFYSFRGESDKKEKKFWKIQLDENGTQNNIKSFSKCSWGNGAICLSHGMLFSCPLPAYIHHLNNFFNTNFTLSKNDFIDIYKYNDINDIIEKLKQPLDFCKYCVIKGRFKYNMPYDFSKKAANEWIFNRKET